MYMKRLARDLWFQIIMIRNMCHYPPELITQLETDVSCLGDSISETDGCLTSPVSICWSWRTDVVPHPSHLPPEIKKKKKLQICSLMVLSSQPKDKNLLKEKVILNNRYLFPSELRCCLQLTADQQCCSAAYHCHPTSDSGVWGFTMFFAEVLRIAFGTVEAKGIFALTSLDIFVIKLFSNFSLV